MPTLLYFIFYLVRAGFFLSRAAFAATAVAAGFKIHGYAVFPVIIGYRAFYGFFREHGTVQFRGGQSVESRYDGFVCQAQRFFHGLSENHFGRNRRRGNRRAAPERLEFYICYNIVFYFQKDFHNVAAFRVADFAYAVGVFYFPNVSRVCEVIHDFFAVHILLLFLSNPIKKHKK